MTNVAILAPGYPGAPGGVTDHTARLIRNWSASGVSVQVIDQARDDVDHWKSGNPRALLIQYVPFLYGRRGLSAVPERLARSAREAGMRVTVFVHEPWVPPTRLPWLILSPLQKRQLHRLLGIANSAVTAVPAWQRLLGERTHVLAVGSTLGDPPAGTGAPLTSPVVFSPFAAGLRWDWIAAAATAIGASPPVIVLGATFDEALAHPFAGQWAQAGWEWRGRLAPGEILESLSRARLVMAPFVDGMTGRRTSALAALSAGARTISSTGPLFDPVFTDTPVIVAASREEFMQGAVRTWRQDDTAAARQGRRSWYNGLFDARSLDRNLLKIVLDQTAAPPDAGANERTPILEPA